MPFEYVQQSTPKPPQPQHKGTTRPEIVIAPQAPKTASKRTWEVPRFHRNFSEIPLRSAPPLQAKLALGQPGDKYEQEADQVARQVVQQIHAPAFRPAEAIQRRMNPISQLIQRRLSKNSVALQPELETSIQQAQGSGQPLSEEIRQPMEQAFEADFSGVKVHTDAQSDRLNQSIQAEAFTTGQNIFFSQGTYQPKSRTGQELIAHELTHVVQQNRKVGKGLQKEIGEVAQLQHYASAEQVIQRRAGIEYETSISARDPDTYKENVANSGWVDQDAVMAKSAIGWNIVSDNSKLEFVTEPPVKTEQLTNVVDNMMEVIKGLPNVLDGKTSNFNTAFPELAKNKNYTILPYKQKIVSGSLQGTIGIPFNRLYAFFDLLTTYNLQANTSLIDLHSQMVDQRKTALLSMDSGTAKAEEQKEVDKFEEDLKKEQEQGTRAISLGDIELYGKVKALVDSAVQELQDYLSITSNKKKKIDQQKELDKLKGLLHFVGQYAVFASRYRESYKKKSFPVMARTSFSSMFEDLPRGYQRKFIELAEQIITGLGLKLTSNVFANSKVDIGDDAKFTLEEWLSSIAMPVNRTVSDGESFKTLKADRMTAPGTAKNPTDNSMGNIKLDDELVVVELRTIKHFAELTTHDPESTKSIVADLAALERA